MRIEAGLSQRQLAGKELTKAFISHVELGRTRPSPRSLQLIAHRLGRDVSTLVDRSQLDPVDRLRLIEHATETALEARELDDAERNAEEGARLATGGQRIHFMRLLAQVQGRRGEHERALDTIEGALRDLEEARDSAEHVWLLYLRGWSYAVTEQLAPALHELEQARDLAERYGISDPRLLNSLFGSLGTVYRRLGRTQRARETYDKALTAAGKLDSLRHAGRALMGLAAAHYDGGELETSLRYYRRAHELFARAVDVEWELNSLRSLAEVHLESGDLEEAHRLAALAISRGAEVGEVHESAVARIILGEVLLAKGRPDEALTLARQAEPVVRAAGDRIQTADALKLIGAIHHARREWAKSDASYQKAIAMLEPINRPEWARVLEEYAAKLFERGLAKQAYQQLSRTKQMTRV